MLSRGAATCLSVSSGDDVSDCSPLRVVGGRHDPLERALWKRLQSNNNKNSSSSKNRTTSRGSEETQAVPCDDREGQIWSQTSVGMSTSYPPRRDIQGFHKSMIFSTKTGETFRVVVNL